MSLIGRPIRIVLVAAAVIVWPLGAALAQEISEARLAAAYVVLKNAPALGNFDNILPGLSTQTKDRLIRVRPDLHREISAVVDETALKLAVRRADLDNDIARIWAKNFTEEELAQIGAFFASDTGKKFKDTASVIGEEILKSSQSWTNRVNDELYDKARTALIAQGLEFGQ